MSNQYWNGIQIDNPADFTNNVNRRTLTSNDAKSLRNTFTSVRIGLSKVIPGIRSTKDRDYPLWPLIKYTRGHTSLGGEDFESPKLAILREMSDILLTEMPNYKTNEDFKNYNYDNLKSYDKLASSSINFTPVEAEVLNLIAKPKIGIIYGNDRLILFYTKRLLKWFDEFKKTNSSITANDIINGMKKIQIKEIIINDYKRFKTTEKDLNKIVEKIDKLYNNYRNTQTQNNYRNTQTQNNYKKKEEPKWEKMDDSDSDDDTNDNYRNNYQRYTVNINKPNLEDLFPDDEPYTNNITIKNRRCPSEGYKPVSITEENTYYDQSLIFHPDKNPDCKEKAEQKMAKLNNLRVPSGGKRRKSKRRKSSRRVKRRNTKRRYRK